MKKYSTYLAVARGDSTSNSRLDYDFRSMKLLLDRIISVYQGCGNKWLTGGDISRSLHEDGYYDSEISIKRTINLNIDYNATGEKSDLFDFIKVKSNKGSWFRKYRMLIKPEPTPPSIKNPPTASIFG